MEQSNLPETLVVVSADTDDMMTSVLILAIAGVTADTESRAAASSQLYRLDHAPETAVEDCSIGGSFDIHLCCDVYYLTCCRSILSENPFCQV